MYDNGEVYDDLSDVHTQNISGNRNINNEQRYSVTTNNVVNVVSVKPKTNNRVSFANTNNITTKTDLAHPEDFLWFGIMILIGAVAILVTEIGMIFQYCYVLLPGFYVGIWLSWILIVTGLLQIKLSVHHKNVNRIYQISTLFMSMMSGVILLIGFILSLVMRFSPINNAISNSIVVNYTFICSNLPIILIFEITLVMVPVILSLVCLFKNLPHLKLFIRSNSK